MSDPRSVEWDGIHARYATFLVTGSNITYDSDEEGNTAQQDLAATLSTNGVVDLVGDGEMVLGRIEKAETDGTNVWVSVQIHGMMTLPGGASADLTEGKHIVGDLGAASAEGYIREVATATAAELGVDRGFIVDPGTTTAVMVWL